MAFETNSTRGAAAQRRKRKRIEADIPAPQITAAEANAWLATLPPIENLPGWSGQESAAPAPGRGIQEDAQEMARKSDAKAEQENPDAVEGTAADLATEEQPDAVGAAPVETGEDGAGGAEGGMTVEDTTAAAVDAAEDDDDAGEVSPIVAEYADSMGADDFEVDTVDFLFGDVRDFLLGHIRARPKPWAQMSAAEQSDVAEACGMAAKDLVRKVVRAVTDHDFDRVVVTLGDVKIMGSKGIEAKITAPNESTAREALGENVGNMVVLFMCDSEDFMNERAMPRVDPDQPDLPFAGGNMPDSAAAQADDLVAEATKIVMAEGKDSTSFLQRRLSIGYNKAAEIMDQLEQRGVVSAPDSTGKREVLMTYPPKDGDEDGGQDDADEAPDEDGVQTQEEGSDTAETEAGDDLDEPPSPAEVDKVAAKAADVAKREGKTSIDLIAKRCAVKPNVAEAVLERLIFDEVIDAAGDADGFHAYRADATVTA